MMANKILAVLLIILVVAVAGLVSSWLPARQAITGLATTATAPSQAVIQKYLSISASDNLTVGIDFGVITELPANYTNASLNYNDTNYPTENDGNETLYWIDVSGDSNTNVDFCVRADAFNTSGGDEIELGNYTFSDATLNNESFPETPYDYQMSTSYVAGQTAVAPAGSNYYRFYLNVSVTQPPGTYNNTVTFLGQPEGVACP
jgi:hypothetical protein